MKEKVLLVGAGGHCKIIIDSINREKYEIAGIIDNSLPIGKTICGIKVAGGDSEAVKWKEAGIINAIITVAGNLEVRSKLIKTYEEIGFNMVSVIHPTAIISTRVSLGKGINVLAGSILNTDAVIGDYTIINTGSIVEHETVIKNNSHIAPGAVITGNCRIGSNTFIGANSVILPNIEVGNKCIIGAGSVVLNHVESNLTVAGNPAKII